ncbi:MAG: glucosyl-3-phosphoglycerate synthase [Actinomycetota bacterium]|jgi:glucosyl-3-phosphoglycerate synthase|nr:glucosyl-3-phosphoglycerate synthase [Actinomycetota bacterium]
MLPHVRQWFDQRTFTVRQWSASELVSRKAGRRIAVVLPARNEEQTVGAIVRTVRRELVDCIGLVDEVLVMDSRSTDATAAVAARAGAEVYAVDDVLPALQRRDGKGEAMWKSLACTTADLLVFVDADLVDFSADWVTALVGPLLVHPEVDLVKAAYDRSLTLGGETSPTGGGRVTELTARPILNAHWPELAGILQPLAGEYAARRSALEQVPFVCGYGVEVGLLVDILRLGGLDALAQVDLGRRVHRNRADVDLVATASAVVQAAARRLPLAGVATTVTRFERDPSGFRPVDVDVPGDERPPYASVALPVPAAIAS